ALTCVARARVSSMLARSPTSTVRAPGTARIASWARCRLRPCKTTSWPEVTRRCAASRPRPSAEPVMKTLATITSLFTPRPVFALLRCLHPPELEHRDGADSSSLAFVLGKARVAPRLLGVDAIAFSAGHLVDGHPVGLGSAFDSTIAGGGQVVIPVR